MARNYLTFEDFQIICNKNFDFLHERYNFEITKLVSHDNIGHLMVYSNQSTRVIIDYEAREREILVMISKITAMPDEYYPGIGDINVPIDKLLTDNNIELALPTRSFWSRVPLEDYINEYLSKSASALSELFTPILVGDFSIFDRSL